MQHSRDMASQMPNIFGSQHNDIPCILWIRETGIWWNKLVYIKPRKRQNVPFDPPHTPFYLLPSSPLYANASFVSPKILISDGNSEKGAHVRSNLFYLMTSRAITNRIFFLRKVIFSFVCARNMF